MKHWHITTWMRPENFVTSGKSRYRRTNIASFHLYEMSRTGNSIKTERFVFARSWEKAKVRSEHSWTRGFLLS
jgi:hypothetical protein